MQTFTKLQEYYVLCTWKLKATLPVKLIIIYSYSHNLLKSPKLLDSTAHNNCVNSIGQQYWTATIHLLYTSVERYLRELSCTINHIYDETLINALPARKSEGAQIQCSWHVLLRSVHAALLEVAGHKDTSMGGSQPAHIHWITCKCVHYNSSCLDR